MTIPVILGSIGVCLYGLSFLLCMTMIILIVIRTPSLKSNVSILLTLNTYFTSFSVCSIMLLMYIYNLYGNLGLSVSFGGRWCVIRTYFAHVCFCALYYSFVLQAIFRLFRIVFYKYKILQTFGMFSIAIILQWILSFLSILPNLLLDNFQYQSMEYNCWISFENIRGLIIATLTIYNNPLSIIFTLYIQIIRYTRHSTHTQRRRQHSNKRDLLILKRIVVLVFTIVGIGLPTAAIVIIYVTTNYLTPFAYHIQGLSISFGVLVASVSSIFITPQIKQLFKQNRTQVRPYETRMATISRHRISYR